MTGVNLKRNQMRQYFLKLKELLHTRQENNETLQSFRTRLRSAMSTLKLIGGDAVFQPNVKDDPIDRSVYDTDLEEEFITMTFLYQADQRVFGERIKGYEQDDEDGRTEAFPTELGNAMDIYMNVQQRNPTNRRYERQFFGGGTKKVKKDADGYRGGNLNACIPCDVDISSIVRGTNKEIWCIKCNKCERWGHTNMFCPENDSSTQVSTKYNLFTKIMLSQHCLDHAFNPNHFYIDSGANFSSTFDPSLLQSIILPVIMRLSPLLPTVEPSNLNSMADYDCYLK